MAIRQCRTPGCTGCEKIGGYCSKCFTKLTGLVYEGRKTTLLLAKIGINTLITLKNNNVVLK